MNKIQNYIDDIKFNNFKIDMFKNKIVELKNQIKNLGEQITSFDIDNFSNKNIKININKNYIYVNYDIIDRINKEIIKLKNENNKIIDIIIKLDIKFNT